MAKKHKSPPLSTIGQRFCIYLENLFGGNQRRAAEYLGCSQAVISKIVLGKQNPGGRVLDLLLQHPKVNPTWLMRGEGEPLLAEKESSTDQGWPVPIAEALLPGPPQEHPNHLTGQIEYVAGSLYRDTAYIYIVRDTRNDHLLPGDRILLDADSARWRKNLHVLDGKLCAVQKHTSGGAIIELCQLICHFDKSQKTVQLREYHSLVSEPAKDPVQNKYHRPDPLEDPSAASSMSPMETQTSFDVIVVENIVAIAIELFRRL